MIEFMKNSTTVLLLCITALVVVQALALMLRSKKQEKNRVAVFKQNRRIEEIFYSIINAPSEHTLNDELNQLAKSMGNNRENFDALSAVFFKNLEKAQDGDERLQLALFKILKTVEPVRFYTKLLDSRSPYDKAHACRMLADYSVGEQAKNIEQYLDSDNMELAFSSAMALSKLGNEEGVLKFVASCKDNYRISKRLVCQLLGEYTEDIRVLASLIFTDCDDYTKATVIKSIAKYNIEDFVGIYLEALESKNANLRVAAVTALGNFGDARFESELVSAASDRMWIVRNAAVKALGSLDTLTATETVSRATSDSEWWVRYNATKTLIGMKDGLEYVDEILGKYDNFASDAIKYVLYRDFSV